LGDRGVDGKTILKWMLNSVSGCVLNELDKNKIQWRALFKTEINSKTTRILGTIFTS